MTLIILSHEGRLQMQCDTARKESKDAVDFQTFVKTHADALVLEPGCSAMQSCRVHAHCSESSPMLVTTHMQAAAARELTVSFNADVADGMPWRFVPAQRSVKVHTSRESLHQWSC